MRMRLADDWLRITTAPAPAECATGVFSLHYFLGVAPADYNLRIEHGKTVWFDGDAAVATVLELVDSNIPEVDRIKLIGMAAIAATQFVKEMEL